jgi:hypothetical protein
METVFSCHVDSSLTECVLIYDTIINKLRATCSGLNEQRLHLFRMGSPKLHILLFSHMFCLKLLSFFPPYLVTHQILWILDSKSTITIPCIYGMVLLQFILHMRSS